MMIPTRSKEHRESPTSAAIPRCLWLGLLRPLFPGDHGAKAIIPARIGQRVRASAAARVRGPRTATTLTVGREPLQTRRAPLPGTRMRMKTTLSILLIRARLRFQAQTPTSANKRLLTDNDVFEFIWVADPELSPDGTQVAFTRVNCDREAYWI